MPCFRGLYLGFTGCGVSESMGVTGKTGITHETLPSFESALLILFCCRILTGHLSLQYSANMKTKERKTFNHLFLPERNKDYKSLRSN